MSSLVIFRFSGAMLYTTIKKNIGYRNTFYASVGTEELAHMEMVSAIVHQLTRNLTEQQIREAGFDTYFVDHTTGVYPVAASGVPFTAAYIGVKGDVITDLTEDLDPEEIYEKIVE